VLKRVINEIEFKNALLCVDHAIKPVFDHFRVVLKYN